MKIGFSGFSASGKTSAAHELVAKIKKRSATCSLVSGAARSSWRLAAGDISLDMHLEVIGRQLAQETSISYKTEYTICDRTMLDYLAYGECRGLGENEHRELFLSMRDFCRHFMRTYDIIFVVEGSFGNRDMDDARLVNDVLEKDFMQSLNRIVDEFDLRDRSVQVAPPDLSREAWSWVQQSLNRVNNGR
ncbi:MAG: AAA family ATPase [Rhodobacterales bacterium]|nr:AAA family ATPase [Rhodobacterales bacterium]